MIDAYGDGLLEKIDFEARIKSARVRLSQLQMQLQSQVGQQERAQELRGIVDNLRMFSCQVTTGLENASWETKRELIKTLVRRIEIDKDQINVVYRVDLFPFERSPNGGFWHYCGKGALNESLSTCGEQVLRLHRQKKINNVISALRISHSFDPRKSAARPGAVVYQRRILFRPS